MTAQSPIAKALARRPQQGHFPLPLNLYAPVTPGKSQSLFGRLEALPLGLVLLVAAIAVRGLDLGNPVTHVDEVLRLALTAPIVAIEWTDADELAAFPPTAVAQISGELHH